MHLSPHFYTTIIILSTNCPRSSSKLGKEITMKYQFFIQNSFMKFASQYDWNNWMAEMMSIKDFFFFSFWLSIRAMCGGENIEGLLEPILLCTFLGNETLYIMASWFRLQIYFKSVWFDNEGLTLCVERVLNKLTVTFCSDFK